MIHIATIVGARPQFVKASVISTALARTGAANEMVIHTGQHYDERMSALFFQELGMKRPDVELAVGSGTHGTQTARMLERIEAVLLIQRPDWLLVYGDTNSTVAGALAASKLNIPIAHVEAGLRSFNRRVPEEVNRVVTDHLSERLFAPTQTAVRNLEAEGIPHEKVRDVGDVMYDAALHYGVAAEKRSCILDSFGLRHKNYILCTLHRAENTDDADRFRELIQAIGRVSERIPVVFPMHPRSRKALGASGIQLTAWPSLISTEPIGYLDMLVLERNATAIATDSGGVQKEAFFCRVPCITLRAETEWSELVELGWNRLVADTDAAVIAECILNAIGTRGSNADPYGSGNAASAIAEELTGCRRK